MFTLSRPRTMLSLKEFREIPRLLFRGQIPTVASTMTPKELIRPTKNMMVVVKKDG